MSAPNKSSFDNLDSIDRSILNTLQKNARLTVKELSAEINLSTSPTFERQKRLERDGFIRQYQAVLDPKRCGLGIVVLCNMRLKQHKQELIQDFIDAVQDIDEIVECYNTSGDYDFTLKIYTRDMESYQRFMSQVLGRIECVGSFNSVFVMSEVKNTHGIPILPAPADTDL